MKLILFILLLVNPFFLSGQSVTDTISIYFNVSAHTISDAEQAKLDSLAYYGYLIPTKSYSVVGYADYVGAEGANLKLSEKRAIAVKEYIKYLGIEEDHINLLIGKGEVQRTVDNTGGYAIDRRVDIYVDNRKKAKKEEKVDLSKVEVGKAVRLNKMFFQGGMAIILDESMPTLEALLASMKDNPTMYIQLEGHVHFDSWKPTVYGRAVNDPTYDQELEDQLQDLSEARANAVRSYLLKNGIEPERVKAKGFSYTKMEESPGNNRRVEVRVLSK